jgi:hypothetical protein
MADVLGDLRKDLEKRLHELAPMVEEHAHVQAALDALKGAGARTRSTARTAARSATTVVRRSPASKNGAGGRGRPRGSGARAQEALKHVHANPGITIGELARKMRLKGNYLYRVLPRLEKEGHVKKQGKGYHPAEASPADNEETPKAPRRRARRT